MAFFIVHHLASLFGCNWVNVWFAAAGYHWQTRLQSVEGLSEVICDKAIQKGSLVEPGSTGYGNLRSAAAKHYVEFLDLGHSLV